MVELVVVGVVAGFLAGISPCILPVLPVVLIAGSGSPGDATPASEGSRHNLARPLSVVLGLLVSFSLLVLVGSEILSLLHLPQNTLRDVGVALLVIVGIGYLVPPVAALIERPFARLRSRQPSGRAGGFVLGLALGLVYAPCAGPILAAITVVGATHRVGPTAVLLTVAFAVGTAVPLFVIAGAGNQLTRRVHALRRQAPNVRRIGGAILIVMAVAIAFNAFTGLQRAVPGYSDALQGSSGVRHQLNKLTDTPHTSLTNCNPNATGLLNCGPAPNFAGITTWLNTTQGKPLSLAQLRGKVVLVDFWTYSCINCQRALPHVEAWYREYKDDGFVVVGVHTPEFAFEHVVSNVRAEVAAFGVRYPVAIDDQYKTWEAYHNQYWPADYLIDAQGVVRYVHFGEGDYANMERLIRLLLHAAHPDLALPPPTSVPNLTPTGEMSPETYVGYERLQYLLPSSSVPENVPASYHFPPTLPLGGFGLSGRWTDHAEEATAGAHAELELGFFAADVYLVLGGHGTLTVSIDGHPPRSISVAGIPRLYTLYHARSKSSNTLLLRVSPGVEVYDFTFG